MPFRPAGRIPAQTDGYEVWGGALMKTLTRKARLFGAALVLAMLLSGARGLPSRGYTECDRNTSWSVWSQWDDHQTHDSVGGRTTETEDTSTRSEQHSTRGEDWTDLQTHSRNADGSSHGHEEGHYTDNAGAGCYSDGIPQKWSHRSDDDTDSKGNRKEHFESISEKAGKCTKYVRDIEWDSKGKLIKDISSETDVPCGKYVLEVLYKGSISVSHSTITYGPNTAKVYLESDGNGTHTGSHEDRFDATMTGECTWSGVFPVAYDVIAKEVKFGDQDELDFSVNETKGRAATVSCWGGSGGVSIPVTTNTYTFRLPPEDGASKTFSIPPGYVSLTFTLRKQGP